MRFQNKLKLSIQNNHKEEREVKLLYKLKKKKEVKELWS